MPDFAAEMAQEYAIGSRVVQMHDFLEGVRALIVDKDNSPKWDPPTAEAVTDAWIDAIFSSLPRSEEHTSELQSLMRISYAVFCLKKKIHTLNTNKHVDITNS